MDVTGTIDPAWQRAKAALLQPFDLGKWFSYGLIFFLQALIEGSSANYSFQMPNWRSGSGTSHMSTTGLKEALDQARAWESANFGLVVGVGVTLALVGVALGLVFLWLGTRGQMMAIRAVMTGRPAVGEHWAATRTAGWSLFKVHLVLAALGLVVWGPLVVVMGARVLSLIDAGTSEVWDYVTAMLPFATLGLAFSAVLFIIVALLRNFVAPVMLRAELPAAAAWTRFRTAARGSFGKIVVFFFLRAVFGLVIGIVATVATLCTCCIGGLPIVHQTLLAPWYFFERAWGLYVLESLGPEMKMF